MLDKCANPVCPALFRKLGSGTLFAFESVTKARPTDITSDTSQTKTSQTPMFFWFCETCSLTFTLGLDAVGQLMLHRIPDGARDVGAVQAGNLLFLAGMLPTQGAVTQDSSGVSARNLTC
jgi:hypothetical protein